MKRKERRENTPVSSLIKVIENVDTNIQVKIKGLLVPGQACKDLGSHHSHPHNEEKN